MVKFTFNNQKEYKSFVTFLYWIEPWLCTKFEYDLGIDLYVQPFDDRERVLEDNSLIAFNKRLLIQLKSTGEYDSSKKCHTIDINHIEDWKRQNDLVVFMKFYLPENTFYYTYIDEIEIKEGNKTQTVYLTKKLDKNSIKEFKDEVLDKLSPVKIGEIEYIPALNSDETIYQCIVDLGRKETALIDKDGQITGNLKIQSAINLIKQRVLRMYEIDTLRKEILQHDTVDKRLKLIQYLYIEDRSYEAKIELIALYEKFKSKEAEVLLFLINKNISYEDLIYLKSVFYLKLERIIPQGAELIYNVVIDGKDYELMEHCPGIIVLPVDTISTIKTRFKFVRSPITQESPMLKNGSVKLFKSFMFKNDVLTQLETFMFDIA